MGSLTSAIMGAMMSGQPKTIGMSMDVKRGLRYDHAKLAVEELLKSANYAPGGEADLLADRPGDLRKPAEGSLIRFSVCVPQAALLAAVRGANRAVGGRTGPPVLRGLLLAAEGEALIVTGYDQSLAIRRKVGAQVAVAGRCVAPGEMLGKLIGALPAGSMVQLEDAGTGELAITAGEGRYSLALSDEPDDYPRLPEFDPEADPVILGYGVFQKALQAVSYAASNEISKGVLCGVNFSDLRATACDGYRSSVFTLEVPEACKVSFTVATDAVKELEKLGLAENDLVFLTQTKSHALFRTGKVSIIASLLAGAYPNVASLIPKTCESTITLNRQEFIESIEPSIVISDAAAAFIKYIKITYAKKTCELSITTVNDAGSATDKIAAQKGDGEDFTVKMYPRWLLDALRHCEGDSVLLSHHVDSDGRDGFLIHNEEGNHKQLIIGMGDPAPRK